ARGGGAKVGDGAAMGISGAVAAAAIGAQGQVAEEGTAGDGQLSRTDVGEAAAPGAPDLDEHGDAGIADDLIVGQDVVGERQVAQIQDRAAVTGEDGRAAIGEAVGHRHPGDGDGQAGADVEDPAGVVAADGQLVRARSFDVQVLGDGQFAAGQRDGLALETGGEVDGVATLGGGDFAAQRAVAEG